MSVGRSASLDLIRRESETVHKRPLSPALLRTLILVMGLGLVLLVEIPALVLVTDWDTVTRAIVMQTSATLYSGAVAMVAVYAAVMA